MSFHEKSAWVMSLILTIAGAGYFASVWWVSEPGQLFASPSISLLIFYVVSVVVLAIVGQVIIAAMAPKEAGHPADEREKTIAGRANSAGFYFLSTGAVISLGLYLATHDAGIMFYILFLSLMVSQIASYVTQIVYFRRGM